VDALEAPVSMPVKQFVVAPVVVVVIVEAAIAAGAALVRPDWLGSVALGAVAAAFGVAVGSLAIRPWKPRVRPAWPTLTLAGHGISLACLLGAAVLLYSAA
jgi:hypothetical protein